MLALDRPLGVVDGLALFGDHADPHRVFYAVTRPRLAAVAAGLPELSFVKFRSADAADGGMGLLSFTTELVASEAQLDEAKDHLVDQGVREPQLVQIPWLGGKAFFAAALEEGDGFVEKLYGEVTPDLMGGNRAMFSARLNEEGARLVEALVQMEGPNPLGVRYELEYAGLRPALDVRLKANYRRVYEELSFGFQFGVAYQGVGVRAGVESATQKLREAGAIEVEVLHFTDDADLHQRVDQAVKWFQDKIMNDFFKSTIESPAQENLLEKAIELAGSLGTSLQGALADATLAGQLAQMLGISPAMLSSLIPGGAAGAGQASGGGTDSTFALNLQFSLRDIHQDELKTITLDWREARAERRIAAPQGLLSRVGVAPTIVEADDTGAHWETLHVNVRPLGDFEGLGVQRMVVQLAYPDENDPDAQKSLVFEVGETEPEPFDAWTNGQPPRYRQFTEVHFLEEGAWPGPPIFTGEWRWQHSLELALHPLTDVTRVEVEISPGTVVFEDTPQVQVDVRIDGDRVATHMITADAPTATFRRRVEPSAAGVAEGGGSEPTNDVLVEARPTWFLAGSAAVQGDWVPVEGNVFLVHRPWRSQRTVRIFPLLPDDFIDALITLTMTENGRSRTEEVRFEPGERRTKTVTLPSLSDVAPPVLVDILVIRGDGSVFTATPFETSDAVIMVRDRDGEHRQIKVRLLAGDNLADHGVMAVQVMLVDDGGETLDTVVFTQSQRDPGILLTPVAEDGGAAVRYKVVRYGLDGLASETPVVEEDTSELLVPAVSSS